MCVLKSIWKKWFGSGKSQEEQSEKTVVNIQEELLKKQEEMRLRITDDIICIMFSADWCGPCRMMESLIGKDSVFQKTLKENNITFLVINTDQNPDISKDYRIESIPSFILLDSKKEKYRSVGAINENHLQEAVVSAIQK
ncbi:MAG: thioredoxin family protein [Patescibacteria group bacterium]|nr:thioredoxin family protein [Patescibacteria group bacterium]